MSTFSIAYIGKEAGIVCLNFMSQCSSVKKVTGYRLHNKISFLVGAAIFLFIMMFHPALRPIYPALQWVLVVIL